MVVKINPYHIWFIDLQCLDFDLMMDNSEKRYNNRCQKRCNTYLLSRLFENSQCDLLTGNGYVNIE